MPRWAPLLMLVGCVAEPAQVRGPIFDVAPPPREEDERVGAMRLAAEAVCAGLDPCEVVGVRAARGTDRTRQAVAIVAKRRDHATRAGAAEAHVFDGRADVFPAQPGGCEPFEVWLLSVEAGRARRVRRLARICNELDLAYHNVAERLVVTGDTITRSVEGDTGWRWSRKVSLRLTDGAVAYEERAQQGADVILETRSRGRSAGATLSWTHASCTPTDPVKPASVTGDALVVPSLDLPDAFHAGGWKTEPMAPCGARVDGASSGIVVEGAPSTATASVEAFVSRSTLFVDVRDDHFSTGGALADRLEVWSSGWDPRYSEGCATTTRLVGFEVRLDGGEPRLLDGNGPAPTVARVAGRGGSTRLAITFVDPPQTLGLVYRDVDRDVPAIDIASGNIDPSDSMSAASIRNVDVASCAIEGTSMALGVGDPLALDLVGLDVFMMSECRG